MSEHNVRSERVESQIKEKQKESDFDIREYPTQVIYSKFTEKLEGDRAELFVPDYQRELVWSDSQQSRFIESIFLNLPVPYIYVSDVIDGEDEGRLEIVDGSQRVRTLVRFMSDELVLSGLEILDSINGMKFSNFPLSRQLRFSRKTIRTIELLGVDEESRRQLFDRLNSGGSALLPMEQRFGSRDGEFITFIRGISSDADFRRLCPISGARERRRDYEEMLARFFAYRDHYREFNKSVNDFINDYVDELNNNGFDVDEYRRKFNEMIAFVDEYFPIGFKKSASNMSVPRIRFEAIAVGVSLALDAGCNEPESMGWLESEEFLKLTRSDASNSRPKLINRIHFVRDSLLGRDVQYAN